VESGAISRTDYLQLKQDLAQNSNDLAAQEKTVRQAEAAVNEAEHSVEQIQRDRVADIYNDLDQRVSSEPALKCEGLRPSRTTGRRYQFAGEAGGGALMILWAGLVVSGRLIAFDASFEPQSFGNATEGVHRGLGPQNKMSTPTVSW